MINIWKTDTDDLFTQSLKLSLVVHVSFVLIFSLKSFIFPSKTIEIPNAIRVDLVGLPDKPELVKKKAKPKPKPKPKPKAKEKPKPKPKKKDTTKSDQQRALEKLNQLAAIEKLKEQKPVKPAQEAEIEDVKPETPEYKGNLVTSGNSFTGLSGIEAQGYWADAKAHVQNFWALPEWLSSARLRAKVVVMIDESGRVTRAEVYQSSGNDAFDNAALSAVEAASPFPVPPERIRDTITSSWMIFNFPE